MGRVRRPKVNATGCVYETVGAALRRRRDCRIGLEGLGVTVGGQPAVIAQTVWDEHARLVLTLESGQRVDADQAVLVDRWRTYCCRPGRQREPLVTRDGRLFVWVSELKAKSAKQRTEDATPATCA